MKTLKEFVNESYQSYIDYVIRNYGDLSPFDTIDEGYLIFKFSSYEEEKQFCKPFMPFGYDIAFKHLKEKQIDGSTIFVIKVDLNKLIEHIANLELPKLIDRMVKEYKKK